MTTTHRGIDYGHGQTNIDKATGIRNGVIPQGEVLQAWCDSSEPYYGKPQGGIPCPECEHSGQFAENWGDTLTCAECGETFEAELPDCAEPISHYYESDGYACEAGESGDIFICKSPYFTYAQYCSPCAPGACYLNNPLDVPEDQDRTEWAGNRCYCFGHDWFEDGKAPYRVYSVETGHVVNPD